MEHGQLQFDLKIPEQTFAGDVGGVIQARTTTVKAEAGVEQPEAVRLEGNGRKRSHAENRLCRVRRYGQRLWLVLESHVPYV